MGISEDVVIAVRPQIAESFTNLTGYYPGDPGISFDLTDYFRVHAEEAAPTYSATSTRPAIATTVIDGNVLTITPGTGAAAVGSTMIIVTATSQTDHSKSTSFFFEIESVQALLASALPDFSGYLLGESATVDLADHFTANPAEGTLTYSAASSDTNDATVSEDAAE